MIETDEDLKLKKALRLVSFVLNSDGLTVQFNDLHPLPLLILTHEVKTSLLKVVLQIRVHLKKEAFSISVFFFHKEWTVWAPLSEFKMWPKRPQGFIPKSQHEIS